MIQGPGKGRRPRFAMIVEECVLTDGGAHADVNQEGLNIRCAGRSSRCLGTASSGCKGEAGG